MKLWKIWQDVNDNYNTFDSAVVAARTEHEARNTPVGSGGTWAPPADVQVELLGTAVRGTKAGVIVASFNAG